MIHGDLTSTMDYWNWVRNTESLNGWVIALNLTVVAYILQSSIKILTNTSPPKSSKHLTNVPEKNSATDLNLDGND